MIASISSAVSASAAAVRTRTASTKAKTGWAFQPLPNLNRVTRQKIGTTRAGWTFSVICTELGYAVHKGRATWDQQRLGIGLRALARESGQSLGKVRRDVQALADLGLVVIHRPNVMHVADPATGRITAKAKGRCETTLIYLTITESVLRPAKVHRGTGDGPTVAPPTAACKVHRGTTVREEKKQRTPDGGAVGIGTPPAAEAGLTAGVNRLPQAETPPPVIPADAGRDEPPLPDGRIVPAAKAATAKATRSPYPEDHAEPRPFTGQDAERLAWTRRRLEAERQAREARDAARTADPQAEAPRSPPPPDRPPEVQDADTEAAKAAVLAALAKSQT